MATQLGNTDNEGLIADWLAAYVDALVAGSQETAALSSMPDEVRRRQLARLAMSLHTTLVPVAPEPAFRSELSRRLASFGFSAELIVAPPSPSPSRWFTVAVAGSVVSAVGLAWMWRRWRPAA